jgi:hypothetical protein
MITLALLLFVFTAEMDPKMRVDLNIAERILFELIGDNAGSLILVRGSYIPHHGAMLTISYRHRVSFPESTLKRDGLKMEEVIKRYLHDYGDLISGIGPDESVAVNFRRNIDPNFRRSGMMNLVYSVKKSDLVDRRTGKITEAEFMSRIRSQQVGVPPDHELFLKVLETAVNSDTTRVFAIRTLTTSPLPDYGILVSGTLIAMEPKPLGNIDPSQITSIEVIRGDSTTQSQIRVVRNDLEGVREEIIAFRAGVELIRAHRQKGLESRIVAYGEFEAQFKSVLLNYGRMLTSLDANGMLRVRLVTDRVVEGIPQSITFSVSKSVINEYDRREITEEQASEKIVVAKE